MQYSDFLNLKNIIEFILLLEKEFVDEKKKITKINIQYVNKEIEDFISMVDDFKWLGFNYSVKFFYETGTDKKGILPGNNKLLSDNTSKDNFLYKKSIIEKINFDNRFNVYEEILNTLPLVQNQKKEFLNNVKEQSKTILKNRKRKQNHSSKKIYLPPLEKIDLFGQTKEYRPFINNILEVKEWGSINDVMMNNEFELSLNRIKNLLEKIMDLIVENIFDEVKLKRNGSFKSIETSKLDIKKIESHFEIKTSIDKNDAFEELRKIFIEDAYLMKGLSDGYPINHKFFSNKKSLEVYLQSFVYLTGSVNPISLLEKASEELCDLYKSKVEKVTILKSINNNDNIALKKKRI